MGENLLEEEILAEIRRLLLPADKAPSKRPGAGSLMPLPQSLPRASGIRRVGSQESLRPVPIIKDVVRKRGFVEFDHFIHRHLQHRNHAVVVVRLIHGLI